MALKPGLIATKSSRVYLHGDRGGIKQTEVNALSEIAAVFGDGEGAGHRIERMASAMGAAPHDAHHTWSGGGAGLSARVQHTTAQSLECQQPHANEISTIHVVFDGYLSNFEDLSRDLSERGANLRNKSDVELALRAYEKWGEQCAHRLQGEFALIVIDTHAKKVFCAQDHCGLRPLYFSEDNGVLVVASAMPALLAGLDRQPGANFDYLAEVLIGEIFSAGQTAWQGVRRVLPAHCMTFSEGRSHEWRYYDLPQARPLTYRRDEDYIEEYRHVLETAIKQTSRTHSPLAIEVSGGLDSSAIFCLAHDMLTRGELSVSSIAAYTMRGEPGAPSDEMIFARAAADHVGRDLHPSELYRPDLAWFDAEAATARDLPSYTNAVQSILMERAMVADGCRVALNGAGGDQWLDGSYGYYEQNLRALKFGRFARNVRRDAAQYGLKKIAPLAVRKAILAALPDPLRRVLRSMKSDYGKPTFDTVSFVTAELADKAREAKIRYEASLPAGEMARKNRQTLDGYGNLRAFSLMYRQRSALGIEGRSPMLTRPFIEFCASMPEDLKFRGGETKWVHRRAMKGIMPDLIVERQDKAHFPERRHDRAINALLLVEGPDVLAQLVDPFGFAAFCDRHLAARIDDSQARPYWSAYMAVAFLTQVAGRLDGNDTD